MDKEFKKLLEIIRVVSKDATLYRKLDEKYKTNRELAFELLQRNPIVFNYFNDDFKSIPEFAEFAVSRKYATFNELGKEIKNNKDFFIKSLNQGANIEIFREAGSLIKSNKDIICKYVIRKPYLIAHAEKNILSDIEVAKRFISKSNILIKEFDDSIKDNEEIANLFIPENGLLLEHFSDRIRKNKNICLKAALQDYKSLSFIDISFRDDKKFMFKVINKFPFAFNYCSERLQKDDEINDFMINQMFYNGDNDYNTLLIIDCYQFINKSIQKNNTKVLSFLKITEGNSLVNKEIIKNMCHSTMIEMKKINKNYAEEAYNTLKLILERKGLSFAFPKVKEMKKIKM